MKFEHYFKQLSDGKHHHSWQHELSEPSECKNRLVRIPTGFGKTLGVLATWLWHRVQDNNDNWPRRLVWCLPMRVLVEQTESEVRSALERLCLLWDGESTHDGKVGVHLLMGGANAGRWHLYPESHSVLIGTQDMLLSRAMNRGYASPRARWPMEFGLLNQDALWVMDEVQLMDVGLATSAQLQAFRGEDTKANKSLRPCFTWWMSATLQAGWLEKSPDTGDLTKELTQKTFQIARKNRHGNLWNGVAKHCEIIIAKDAKWLAKEVANHHFHTEDVNSGPTLVVLNTVKRALEVWTALRKDKTLQKSGTDIRMVHSRFRPAERMSWRREFLNRDACGAEINRIIVSTQVIEAGVDFSASLLVTELAPWPSLVQRFGRCARWGGKGKILIADFEHKDDKKAAPYAKDELDAAREACSTLSDVGPIHLEAFEENNCSLLPRLYPYDPRHLLLRHELDELFDTTPDLSGADIDISRFIRSGDERDVQVFWAHIDGDTPSPTLKPTRDELCAVPFLKAQEWLCKPKSENLKSDFQAWVWDWLDRKWRPAKRRDIHPGQTLLVESRIGGYRLDCGWDPKSRDPVAPVKIADESRYTNRPCWKRNDDGWRLGERRVREFAPENHADDAEDDESLSILSDWQTIATHGKQVGDLAHRIAKKLAPAHAPLMHLAGRWHDLGKSHPAFQGSIQADDRPASDDIAKAPDKAWPCRVSNMYRIDVEDQRRGFRHELASTLGLFGVLQRHDRKHPALLGPWGEWFEAMGGGLETEKEQSSDASPTPIEQEILDLNPGEFDLLAYLVCTHHGKVRMAWHASPADQKAGSSRPRIRGIQEGDILPSVLLLNADGDFNLLPPTRLDLSPAEAGLHPRTGRSWIERVLSLVEHLGPFTLAWLEALLRSADQRASEQTIFDTLLQNKENDDAKHSLDRGRRALAQPTARGTPTPTLGSDSPPCRQLDGDGGRTGGRSMDPGTTRPPYSATRYVETPFGILSYRELAPLLAERVGEAEAAIVRGKFSGFSIHDLLPQLHRRICGDVVPDIAGRWRLKDVRVSAHRPPPYWRVPVLMHEYSADVETRLSSLTLQLPELLIESLTFAEGKFLEIHPFEDFNGRVARLYLVELMCRLELPEVDPAVSLTERPQYFSALQAFDGGDPRPLAAIWRRRLEGTPT